MIALQCRRCNHSWTPRIKRPVMCPRCHSPFWDRDRQQRAVKLVQSISNPESKYGLDAVASALNRMVRDRLIKGWVIYGSVAHSLWAVPLTTMDVDVLVPVKNDLEYTRALSAMATASNGFSSGGFALRIADVRVEVFPANVGPLYEAAFHDAAKMKTSAGEPVLVVRPEYLALMAVAAWRFDPIRGVDDRQRAQNLIALGLCDMGKMQELTDQYADTFPRIEETEFRRRVAAVLEPRPQD